MTRALVLGGAGFVGVAACKELMRRGVETIAAGRKDRPYGTFTSYVAFDRTDDDQLERAFRQVEPDVVLDLACYLPGEVRSVAGLFKGSRYVFVSTGVYPNLDGKPAREDDFVPLVGDPPPKLDYMNGKRWCETMLARETDLPWTVIRPPADLRARRPLPAHRRLHSARGRRRTSAGSGGVVRATGRPRMGQGHRLRVRWRATCAST